MKTILVTGGMGFIGSHTTVALHQKGYNVLIADNLSCANIYTLDRIEHITVIRPECVKVDLSNEKECSLLFSTHQNTDGVINFAAFKAVGESCAKPLEYSKNNLGILLNVLTNMKKYGIKYIVHSSSCTVYGQPDTLPITEDSPTQPAESPYGNTKQMAEDIDRKSTRLNSSHQIISYAVFCLKKK